MSRADLKRLQWLGEKRKDNALKNVAAKQHAVEHAEDELSEAREIISERIRTAGEQETRNLSRMTGQTLSYSEIVNFNSDRGAIVQQLDDLSFQEKLATRKRDNANSELKEANKVFRQRDIRLEKLRHLIKLENRKHRRKSMSLSEASEDDFLVQPHGKIPGGGQSM